MSLDARTLILVAGTFYLALPWAVWLALRAPRSIGPLLWCGGGMVGGVGFALMGLRGVIPDQLSYLAGQPALVLGALMAAQSLRHDLGRPWKWQNIATVILAYALVLQYALANDSPATLGVLIRVVNLLAILPLISASWQVGRKERSKNALTIALAYSVQCVAVSMNMVTAVLGSQEIQTLAGQSINTIAYLVMILVSLTGAMAYLGLSLERMERETLKLVHDAAQIEIFRGQRRLLIEAGRKNILDMLTRSLSHAMRQPLTAAGLRLALCRQLPIEDTKNRERLKNSLLDAITDIQRTKATIESTRSMVKARPHNEITSFDTGALLSDLHRLVQHQAQSQATWIRLPSPLPAQIITADRVLLTYALLQLLQNALTAVSASDVRVIELQVESAAQAVRIHITDSGPGLPEQVILRFSGKYEVWPANLQCMGLFVVNHIIKEQRGALFLDNPPTGGARVTVQLPLDS